MNMDMHDYDLIAEWSGSNILVRCHQA
jgi:hypothetical protein